MLSYCIRGSLLLCVFHLKIFFSVNITNWFEKDNYYFKNFATKIVKMSPWGDCDKGYKVVSDYTTLLPTEDTYINVSII